MVKDRGGARIFFFFWGGGRRNAPQLPPPASKVAQVLKKADERGRGTRLVSNGGVAGAGLVQLLNSFTRGDNPVFATRRKRAIRPRIAILQKPRDPRKKEFSKILSSEWAWSKRSRRIFLEGS